MGNEFFMGGQVPYRANGYMPSYLSTQMAGQSPMGATNTNIVWTMGAESAKAYPLLPGRTMMLMDSESSRFFIKTVDNSGYATLKAYTFQEEPLMSAPVGAANYVTKEQLDAAIADALKQVETKTSLSADNVAKVADKEEVKKTKNLL